MWIVLRCFVGVVGVLICYFERCATNYGEPCHTDNGRIASHRAYMMLFLLRRKDNRIINYADIWFCVKDGGNCLSSFFVFENKKKRVPTA